MLHFILLNALRQRKYLRGEFVFICLILSLECWFLANFISLFSHLLFTKPLDGLRQFFNAIACGSAALFSPLLIHSLIDFAGQKEYELPRFFKYGLLSILYTSTLFSIPAILQSYQSPRQDLLESLAFFIWPFSCYFAVVLILAIYLSSLLAKISGELEDIRFYRAITRSLAFVWVLLVFTEVLEFRDHPQLGELLELMTLLSAVLPTLIFSYYIYRYNYMEFVLKRSLVNSILLLFIFSLYLFGIHKFEKRFQERYNLNFDIVQAILVLTMVFVFHPLKNNILKGITRLFYHRQGYYHTVFDGLDRRLTLSSLVQSPQFLNDVAYILSKSLVVQKVQILFFEKTETGLEITEATSHREDFHLEVIVEYLESGKKGEVLLISEIENKALKKEMAKLKAHFIIPIYKEEKLLGILALGKRPLSRKLYQEELDLLRLVSFQLITALENANLIRKTIQLERKMMEMDKLTSLGQLSASVAHEVKNPLSSIKAITQVLQEELDKKYHEDLEVILSEITRLARVVDQLLEYARPEDLQVKKYPLKKIIDNVLMVLGHEARLNGVVLKNEIHRDLEVCVNVETLKDVFFNLILNGIQALSKGGCLRILSLSLKNKPHKPEQIAILVWDNGEGIPPEHFPHIFEPFYTSKANGTGLGLSIVKKKLEDIGASIWVENDHGAKFTVLLPPL